MRLLLPIVCLILMAGFSIAEPKKDSEGVYYYNSRRFTIPLQMVDRSPTIKEIRLFVSEQGGPWRQLTSAGPREKAFDFTAGTDGLYSFATQVAYTDGTEVPARDQLSPEMKVHVDTTQPRITVRPFSSNAGEAGVEWDIVDETLDPKSIKLEYRWPSLMREFAPINPNDTFNPHDSRSWALGPKQIEIRVYAKDRAGNFAYSQPVVTSPGVGNRAFPLTSVPGHTDSDPGTRPLSNTHDMETKLRPIVPRTIYVKDTNLSFSHSLKLGSSGLKMLYLYQASGEKLSTWTMVKEVASEVMAADGKLQPGDNFSDGTRAQQLTLQYDVKSQGIYNFIIIAENRAGLKSQDIPKAGDPPMVRVIVDKTDPKVTLADPKVSRGDSGPIVEITWTAEDEYLESAPITLKYSEQPNGPWIVIRQQLENSRKFLWPVPTSAPTSFYLRVEAVDKAGNIGFKDTDHPIYPDTIRPQIENVEVGPVSVQAGPFFFDKGK